MLFIKVLYNNIYNYLFIKVINIKIKYLKNYIRYKFKY